MGPFLPRSPAAPCPRFRWLRGYDDAAASSAGVGGVEAKGMTMLANRPTSAKLAKINSALAFWGDFALQGNDDGLQITDILNPKTPAFVGQLVCPGAQNDVLVRGAQAFLSGASQGRQPAYRRQLREYGRIGSCPGTGLLDETCLVLGGSSSASWHRGHIWTDEITRGFDVLAVSPALVGAAARVREPYLNAQSQEPLRTR